MKKDMSVSKQLSLQDKIDGNIWDHLKDMIPVIKFVLSNSWCWTKNTRCKYVNLRIDTRSGHCILSDRDGNRISPDDFAYQYGDDEEHN